MRSERLLFLDRWGAVVDRGDPFYNPNLNHNDADCTLRREGAKARLAGERDHSSRQKSAEGRRAA